MKFKLKSFLAPLLLAGIWSSCAQQPILMHPSRQAQPIKTGSANNNIKKIEIPKPIKAKTLPDQVVKKPAITDQTINIEAQKPAQVAAEPAPTPVVVDNSDPKVIGAILPLTGKNESLGQHALNAIRLALELNKPEPKLRLVLFDSQSSADVALKGLDKLVLEDKAVAILGGFSGKEATSLATRAEELQVPYFGFSQKTDLTDIGDFVFRNAVTPEMQVDKLVQFAFDTLGARRFAIVYPNDTYGVEFGNAFWDHVLARGGQITAAQTYDPKETDFSELAQKLLGLYHIDARKAEYAARLKELKAAQKNSKHSGSSRDSWSQENVLPPIVDFDAIFIPDSSKAYGQIHAFLKYYNVGSLNFLGTNIWNTADLPKRTQKDSSKIFFVDAVDSSNTAVNSHSFYKDYSDLYGEPPTLLEIQVFEAAKILKDQLLSSSKNRTSLAESLRYLGRSEGVTGELRMSESQEIERPIHVLSLDGGLVKKIE